jgi:hypothetical protein
MNIYSQQLQQLLMNFSKTEKNYQYLLQQLPPRTVATLLQTVVNGNFYHNSCNRFATDFWQTVVSPEAWYS